MVDLNEIDVRILKFVKKRGSVSIEEIECEMRDISAVPLRVKQLATYDREVCAGLSLAIEDTAYLEEECRKYTEDHISHSEPIGLYHITQFGEKSLQDFEHKTSSHKRELWLKNAWIPIIVSFITTSVTNYILPKLPQILQWFASIL